MKIHREDWWPTPIWFFDIPTSVIDPAEIEKDCYLQKSFDVGNIISNVGGWQSSNIFLETCQLPSVLKLMNEIQNISPAWYNDLGVKNKFRGKLDNFWININSKGNYNNPHVHQSSIFSGTYYVKTNSNSGNIVFYNDASKDHINQTYTDSNNPLTVPSIKYNAIVGRVIVFPSWIQHSVDMNNSTEERISISFNFD